MKKIKIYSHNFLNNDSSWIYVFLDQIRELELNGLVDAAETIDVVAVGSKPELLKLMNLCKTYPKIKLTSHISDVTNDQIRADFNSFNSNDTKKFITEYVTLNKLWHDSQQEDFYGLYFHAKGNSRFTNDFQNGANVPRFKNFYYWRKFLEWGVIERWRDCVTALEQGYQMAGCNLNTHPLPHFDGNFWWFDSTYIKNLDDNTNSSWWKKWRLPYYVDRMCDECWPFSQNPKLFNLHSPPAHLCQPGPGLTSEAYYRHRYESK